MAFISNVAIISIISTAIAIIIISFFFFIIITIMAIAVVTTLLCLVQLLDCTSFSPPHPPSASPPYLKAHMTRSVG